MLKLRCGVLPRRKPARAVAGCRVGFLLRIVSAAILRHFLANHDMG